MSIQIDPGAAARSARWVNSQAAYWVTPIVILVVWQYLVGSGIVTHRILPEPLSVVRAAGRLAASGQLFDDIAVSTERALLGLLIGGSIGFALGLLNGLSRLSEKFLDSTIQMIRTVPFLALLPLVILWFGVGESARVFLISLGVFFPIYLNTFHGIRNVDPQLVEMGRVYGLSSWSLFWHFIFAGALSSILVGLRFALGIMWLTLIVAETIAANSGIGYLATNAREFIQTDVLVFSLVLYACLGKLADVTARLLERRLLAWHPNYQRA
jgi:sulfonate transport system permease protein